MRIGKVLGIWAMIAGLLFWNGVLGLGFFSLVFGREAGEMMTFFIALIIIGGAARPFLLKEPECSRAQAIRIGILWMVLTVVFEFGLGRVARVFSYSMSPGITMWDGSFWPLIVLAIGMAPITWLRRTDLPLTVTK